MELTRRRGAMVVPRQDAGRANSFTIGPTEDAASGRAARPGGTDLFRQTLLARGEKSDQVRELLV